MTDREVMQQTLEALQYGKTHKAITILREALEQPEQQAEPVAWNAGVPPMWPQQKEGETFSVAYIAQPEQQAEPPPEWPLIKNILDEYGLDAIAFVADWKAAQQQAEPIAWDKPSASFDEWWDSYRHDNANPFDTDSFAYWAWAGWKAALRGKNT